MSDTFMNISTTNRQKQFVNPKNFLIYQSRKMQTVIQQINQFIMIYKPVLITGETGTGKELIARLIHSKGPNPEAPYIAINCAAVPHTLWESELFGYIKGSFTDAKASNIGHIASAENGTLFFDEIGEMPLDIQAKLLRLLQENEYRPIGSNKTCISKCRFVFATNRNLLKMVKEGKFREDLYYRINVFTLTIPTVRERKEDIPILVEYFLKKYRHDFNLSPKIQLKQAILDKIRGYNWPGNIREIENFIIRVLAYAASCDDQHNIFNLPYLSATHEKETMNYPYEIDTDELKENTRSICYDEILNNHSMKLIKWALTKTRGNKTMAAAMLGIKRTTLIYKIKEHNIMVSN